MAANNPSESTQPSALPSPADLLRDLIALPAPPGSEDAVRDYLCGHLQKLGLPFRIDAKGNLLTTPADRFPDKPRVVVTAHMDEIALMISGQAAQSLSSGERLVTFHVAPLGGAHPWKWGESPVEILASDGSSIAGILSFGSIHTASPASVVQNIRDGHALTWEMARLHTAQTEAAIAAKGVRVGSRVVLGRERRTITDLGNDRIAGYFFDDRADLVAWLLALEQLKGTDTDLLFAATVSEEVGGEGALYLMQNLRPDICVALEIGPTTPENRFAIDDQPTVWVSDGYSAMLPRDLDLLDAASKSIGLRIHWQLLTRGGSDASCAAAHGLCARPVTIAFAAENSHGLEIMHRNAPANLAKLLVAYLAQSNAA